MKTVSLIVAAYLFAGCLQAYGYSRWQLIHNSDNKPTAVTYPAIIVGWLPLQLFAFFKLGLQKSE